ncbi:MAG TPA: molybdenum ABC transporter ATP-binding protein [Methylophaga aminisulfidivorans]|uniref:molybdenum ABC transporter ATP-binding protein n=1 Tax=Methylophaga TaxID=40222 RepID=UPI001774411E|nr:MULTISPECIES: molybdenum ABC transporter ATP-binding protein [Methylophaga]HIC47260.1 molybdenum ABC transporter ATP-binding protein [Methylophaga sp.]HIM40624.1 molybdenum ABC transporter ATP-binding protein [Methylophaga aminisulfidivorans]
MSKSGIETCFYLQHPGFTLDIDLTIPAQGVTALFGPSGSGKSTILRCIAGLEKAKGKFVFDGNVWQDDNTFIPPHQRPIAYVFQESALFPHLSVMANLNYAFKRRKQNNHEFSLDKAIELLGIAHLLDRKPAKLSGGEKQRVAIARSLAVNPKLLLMDEPLAALDVARKREFLPFLEKLHDTLKMPVIYVSHSPTEVARLADHIVLLKEGRVEATGPLNQTLSRLDLSSQMDEQASVIIEARIEQLQSEWHLAEAAFEGGSMWVRDMNFVIGSQVRLQVLARDVSLTLSPDKDSSIANTIEAIIEEVGAGDHPAILLVRLKIGANFLLCRLTSRSFHHLGVSVGDKVWAQIKSAAIIE